MTSHVNQGGCLKDDYFMQATQARAPGATAIAGFFAEWYWAGEPDSRSNLCGDGVVFGDRVGDGRCMRMRMESSSLQKRGGRGPACV